MTDFRMTCRQCFMERGQSILLEKKDNGDWVCPVNKSHHTINDIEIV